MSVKRFLSFSFFALGFFSQKASFASGKGNAFLRKLGDKFFICGLKILIHVADLLRFDFIFFVSFISGDLFIRFRPIRFVFGGFGFFRPIVLDDFLFGFFGDFLFDFFFDFLVGGLFGAFFLSDQTFESCEEVELFLRLFFDFLVFFVFFFVFRRFLVFFKDFFGILFESFFFGFFRGFFFEDFLDHVFGDDFVFFVISRFDDFFCVFLAVLFGFVSFFGEFILKSGFFSFHYILVHLKGAFVLFDVPVFAFVGFLAGEDALETVGDGSFGRFLLVRSFVLVDFLGFVCGLVLIRFIAFGVFLFVFGFVFRILVFCGFFLAVRYRLLLALAVCNQAGKLFAKESKTGKRNILVVDIFFAELFFGQFFLRKLFFGQLVLRALLAGHASFAAAHAGSGSDLFFHVFGFFGQNFFFLINLFKLLLHRCGTLGSLGHGDIVLFKKL